MLNTQRFVGIDMGAETIKIAELTLERNGQLRWTGRQVAEHKKEPVAVLDAMLNALDWPTVAGTAVTGRFSRTVKLPRIPVKQAQSQGFKYLNGQQPASVVSIGSHGFSVLEMRSSTVEMFRENSRCSQGTGNFLRQLVERFDLTIEEASEMCEQVTSPAPLSGRCPVILKTDMTHLANKGEPQANILAGLYDAVCQNVQVLIKPRVSPKEVALIGGVTRSNRIRNNFADFLTRHGMRLLPQKDDNALYFEALGCAVLAARTPQGVPSIDDIFVPTETQDLAQIPPLSQYADKVKRLSPSPKAAVKKSTQLVLGFDIGSTGSKVVAVDLNTQAEVWEAYVNTCGAPVKAAQVLMQQFTESAVAKAHVVAMGVTGSGREIVGSLMTNCFGKESVFVINEIAAHAEGALRFDKSVDTIFEIGGQDAKYIRLTDGRISDAAMNEACSAGTGSFIEEQGNKFSGITDVVHLAGEALEANFGVSLGQHCSVFMAEIIDEAVASHVPRQSIIAGIYDSIIQNYLNRVKGSRSVGQVIFCQGMPFSSDALAASVARQTGAQVIIPPNPGTVGALGIALLTIKKRCFDAPQALNVARFLQAGVTRKDVFVCKSKKGCGGTGNHCRIDRITTVVDNVTQKFTWGGGCSLYDKGTGKKKLPDLSPDPFREREALVQEIRTAYGKQRGNKTIAITDEFVLKSLFPFFTSFLYELGFDPVFFGHADQAVLKRGIEDANVPFCAPMQQYHGVISSLVEMQPDYLFLPMLRGTQRIGTEPWARSCPIVKGSADMLIADMGDVSCQIISPVINIGKDNFRSEIFINSCKELVKQLGVSHLDWQSALDNAEAIQKTFDEKCLAAGAHALEFCRTTGVTPVVVLGRAYTIHNTVLNSNVPSILREQGAIAIPVDCYPIDDDTPIFPNGYWGYGQKNLRAAHQVRRTPGVYSLYASNYSCGPDSFNLYFYSYIMEGKPFSVIETDGHSGDAGTKTRIEAFLYCVEEDLQREGAATQGNDLYSLQNRSDGLDAVNERNAIVLFPRMGPGAEALAASLRGLGIRAESLPMPDAESLSLGRRYTSGKECFPLVVTLGSLLQRLQREPDDSQTFSFFMPTANGPCRFGSYNILDKIVLERLGYKDRVSIWSPIDEDYFGTVPDGFAAIVYAMLAASDALLEGLYHSRPVEITPGAAKAVWGYYHKQLLKIGETYPARSSMSAASTLTQVLSGNLFGISDLLKRAGHAFLGIMDSTKPPMPEVLVVGEIYVRCDAFANDWVIDKLEERGIRCKFAPFTEWLEYTDYQDNALTGVGGFVSSFLQASMQTQIYNTLSDILGWPRRTTVQDALLAAKPYIRQQLSGEAVLTIGGAIHEYLEGNIHGAVSVGPLECMPSKIAENQFCHVAEKEGLHSLTLHVNGDPVDPEILDNFAYEVHSRFERDKQGRRLSPLPIRPRPLPWIPYSRLNPRDD